MSVHAIAILFATAIIAIAAVASCGAASVSAYGTVNAACIAEQERIVTDRAVVFPGPSFDEMITRLVEEYGPGVRP